MQPTPPFVAETVQRILVTEWPQDLQTELSRLRSLGIETDTATEAPALGASRSWHGAAVPAWGTARAGWGTYEDRPADVSWFLWLGEPTESVLHAADELVDLFRTLHGEPTETTASSTSLGGAWWWQLPSHDIEVYAHAGAPTPEGDTTGPACVQLSVDLRELAEVREDEARRLRGTP